MAKDQLREDAISRLKAKRDFSASVVSYVAINAMLIGIWAISGGGYFWPIWVMLGWGVGLAMHAWTVYGRKPITNADIEKEISGTP